VADATRTTLGLGTVSGVTPYPDSGSLMSGSHHLPRGPRVRLRLASARDEPAIAALLKRANVQAPELEAARLVRVDPRRRVVICGMGLVDSSETLLGIGEIELRGGHVGAPALLVVDTELTSGLAELLARALNGRAAADSRTRAA
jgi:hypothetical protein